MVQRLVEGSGEPGTGNCGLSWQGVHFAHNSDRAALGKIGDMLLQLKNGGEIKVPVGLTFQQRRCYDSESEEQELAPGAKRSKLKDMTDVSFKSATWATSALPDTSFENRPLQTRNRLPFTVASHSYHPLDEPSPLGLTLKKTPSFLDLVSMTVGQGCGNNDGFNDQGLASRAGIPNACPTQGKLKASNFPASTLKIGSWERVSRYEGDVVAKCYYAKRKLVWEVLETGLKSKIELQWSDISAIRASYGEGQPGVLEVEVSRPPLFFKETNPQPRKHTLWEATSDFTGGEATIRKTHVLQFPEGVLNKHYEKLLQCDARLKALAGPGTHETHPQEPKRDVGIDATDEHVDPPTRKQSAAPKVKLEMAMLPLENRCSPSSVMESRGSDDSDTEECTVHSNSQALVEAPGKRSEDTVDQKPPRGVLVLTDNDVLNEIAQILLGETNAAKASPDRGLFRVSSMSEFFDNGWVPASSYSVSDWNSADCGHGNEDYGSDDRNASNNNNNASLISTNDQSVLFELDEKPNVRDGNSSSLHESVKQCFSRHGSSGDLLVNLPRIASLPQLFENGMARRDSHLSLLELL